jgi:hypothetical protein
MDGDEKQKLLALQKQLAEVRAEIVRVLADIKGGIFLNLDKSTKLGGIIRGLRDCFITSFLQN